jgi:transglutaminase-like putative cysteine protease
MKLCVVHRTLYQYGDAVTTSHHEARLAPRDTELQRTLSHELVITPAPEARRRRFDYFGNRTVHFSLSEPHRSLEVRATSTVEARPLRPPLLATTPAWESVRDRLRVDRRRDVLDAYSMCFDSPHVHVGHEVADYAAPSFEQGRPVLEAVGHLMARIHEEFTYDPRATEVSTPLVTLLQDRRGVCQDFAHLAIGCLRAVGLPARYVSGYLLTRPPPGKIKLIGADASHAWFSTFIPEYGWVDFDPTNNLIPSDEHITIAYGRDFADVTPIRGVILGGGQHELTVAVDVNQVDDVVGERDAQFESDETAISSTTSSP